MLMSAKGKDKLDSIRSQFFTRGLSLAKMTLKVGSAAANRALGGNKDFNVYVTEQIRHLTEELGQLKGSLMKVGQLLSTYGEHFLPKEANELLKSLQFRSPPLAWKAIEKVIVQELGHEKLKELEIEEEPYAAASIGQVHRATVKKDGRQIVIKVQYPGVDTAVDTDLKFLRLILGMLSIGNLAEKFDEIFDEVRSMLEQEMDYYIEADFNRKFRHWLEDDARYAVARILFEYSTSKVLTSEYMPGVPIDGLEVKALSLQRRNQLGLNYLELYFRELFQFGYVQTDPHFGNYRVQLGGAHAPDRLVLLDFGAVRQVPSRFLENYLKIIAGGLQRDARLIEAGGRGLGLLRAGDPQELVQKYVDLCILVCEPFAKPEWLEENRHLMNELGEYDWGNSDLPKRVAKKGAEIATSFRLRQPPREVVFLDRKLGGAFVFLSVLGCRLNARKLLEPMLTAKLAEISRDPE